MNLFNYAAGQALAALLDNPSSVETLRILASLDDDTLLLVRREAANLSEYARTEIRDRHLVEGEFWQKVVA